MSIPEFNDYGDLPPGLHKSRLADLLDRFGKSTPQRAAVGQRLERIYELAVATGHVRRFVVFGSFRTERGIIEIVED